MKIGKIEKLVRVVCAGLLFAAVSAQTTEPTETEEPTWTWYPSFTFFPSDTGSPSGTLAPEAYLEVRPSGTLMDYPGRRYHYWDDLTDMEREAAEKLVYDKFEWENPGINIAESFYWAELPPNLQEATAVLGFDEFTWDCYQHHYYFYSWFELEYMEVAQYLKKLGWTRRRWDEDRPPASDSKDWAQLTNQEKAAAEALCYFEETWDALSFSDWDQTLLNTAPPPETEAPSAAPTQCLPLHATCDHSAQCCDQRCANGLCRSTARSGAVRSRVSLGAQAGRGGAGGAARGGVVNP